MTFEHTESYPNKQRGATRQSRLFENPLPVLKQMMEKLADPHAANDREITRKRFMKFMHSPDGKRYHDGMFEYWFKLNYRTLLATEFPKPEEEVERKREERKAEKEEIAAELTRRVEETIKSKAQAILLDHVLPNGKALRDCTGRDCKQMGGWLAKIAERVKPTQLVGKVLQEDDVRKLFPG